MERTTASHYLLCAVNHFRLIYERYYVKQEAAATQGRGLPLFTHHHARHIAWRAYAVAISLILTAGFSAYGADETQVESTNRPSYTLQQCIQMGLERSITLQNATRDQEIAQSRIKQTRAQLLPSVTLSANYLHLDEKPYIGDETGLDNQYDATAGVQQLLFSGGSVSAALKASREYLKYAASATLQRNHVLIRDIKQSFYSVLYAESALRVAQQSLKQLKEFETQTRLKFENGTASEFDYLSAQVKVVNERPQVIAAENTLSLARESFKNLIYLNTADFQLTGELEYIPIEVELDHLYELAINRRPELQEQQALIGMRVQDVLRNKRLILPPSVRNSRLSGEKSRD